MTHYIMQNSHVVNGYSHELANWACQFVERTTKPLDTDLVMLSKILMTNSHEVSEAYNLLSTDKLTPTPC